jgi:hypothetical protein
MFTFEFEGNLEGPIRAESTAYLKERLKGLCCPTHGPLQLECSNSSNGYQVEVRMCCDEIRKTVADATYIIKS